MSISNIQNSSNTNAIVNSIKYSKEEINKNDTTNSKLTDDTAAVYTPSDPNAAKNNTYTVNMADINKLKADVDRKTEALRNLVEKMITKQGYTADDVLKALDEGKQLKITPDAETQTQAQSEIGTDGFWGVKQTSDRILEMAKQLSGGDPAKAEAMRDAVKEGFQNAEKAFGDKLPDISNQTYDAVMKGFDEWEGNDQTSETEPSK